jgi:hypothetical protein
MRRVRRVKMSEGRWKEAPDYDSPCLCPVGDPLHWRVAAQKRLSSLAGGSRGKDLMRRRIRRAIVSYCPFSPSSGMLLVQSRQVSPVSGDMPNGGLALHSVHYLGVMKTGVDKLTNPRILSSAYLFGICSHEKTYPPLRSSVFPHHMVLRIAQKAEAFEE